MGKWTTGNGLQLKNDVLFGNEFTDFGGKTLTVATLQVKHLDSSLSYIIIFSKSRLKIVV